MDSRMWLLVDWVDEGNDSPVYGIVNIDITAYDDNEMIPGNVIFIRTQHSAPRQAKIVGVSERRKNIEKQKALLERQEQQVNDVLQRCMQTINEIRSEDSYYIPNQLSRPPVQRAAQSPVVVVGRTDNSDSDRYSSESNFMGARRNSYNFNRFTPTFNSRHNRMPSMGTQLHNALTENSSRRRSIVCSTPLPSSSSQQVTSLTINQATQTEMSFGPIVERIEMLEETANKLYGQLLSMMSQATVNPSTSELDHNNELVMVRPNSIEYVQQSSGSSLSPGFVDEILAEEVECSNGGSIGVDQQQHNSSNDTSSNIGENQERHNSPNVSISNIGVGQELHNSSNDSNSNILRVRRVSPQITNNIEPVPDDDLVPLGNSHAAVPRRLLNDIDWKSYTSATRQLLQAIFPRRVLATHSLTGKQSPAFMNRPAKKILDPPIVEDIVTTVSTKCCVPKNLVRNVITIKCTDEAKLYRNRQRRRQLRQSHNNEENLQPSTPSSD